MKFLKVFSIVALSAMALAANAENPQVQITLKGQSNAYAAELNLIQDAQYAEYNSKFESNPLNAEAIDLYAIVGSDKFSTLFAEDINGIKIGFKGNSNTSYTMTFTSVEGTVKLYDAVEDSVIVVVNNGTYSFTATAKTAVSDRFQVGVPAYKRTVTAGQYGTICYPKAITAVTGGTLYELTSADQTTVYGDVVTSTEAGKSYAFKADADATELVMTYTGEDETAPVATTGMGGTFVDTTVPAGKYGILGSSVVLIAEGNALLANRAYIDVEALRQVTAPRRGRAIFMISNTATGMELIEAPAMKEGKMIMNGRMVIVKDGKMFNAQGAAL